MLTTGRLDDDDAMLQLYGGERKVRDIIKLIPYFFQYIPSNYYYHFFASTLMMPPSDHEFIKGNVNICYLHKKVVSSPHISNT